MSVIGINTPERTKANLEIICKETNIEFIDSSWKNDACDSISNSELDLHIFLPNSDKMDNSEEEFNTFCIAKISNYGEGEYDLTTDNITKVIDFVKDYAAKMKRTYVIINGTNITYIQKINMAEARETAIKICDLSQEVIVRQVISDFEGNKVNV